MEKNVPTILVVEDEKSLLKVWAEIFRREGLNVLSASDEQSAINMALRWRPNLVLVDLVMSISLIKKLRENRWGQTVPVMFLSGWLDMEAIQERGTAASETRDSYFHDNWNFDQVVQEVKNKLEQIQAGQARAKIKV